jgi:hypothetical protein
MNRHASILRLITYGFPSLSLNSVLYPHLFLQSLLHPLPIPLSLFVVQVVSAKARLLLAFLVLTPSSPRLLHTHLDPLAPMNETM